jgi:hypothetical protein
VPTLNFLLLAYGIAFGVQNKLPFLRGKLAVLDALIKCTYCLGFHTGYLAWGLYWVMERPSLGTDAGSIALSVVLAVVTWGLSSAAFSYGVDTAIRWLEYRPR